MQALARLERVEAQSGRASPRRKLSLDSSLAGSGDEIIIHDLSTSGILIETNAKLRKSERLEVDLPELGATLAKVVWNSGQYFGCQFDRPIPKAALSAAVLRNPFDPSVPPSAASEVKYDEHEDFAEIADGRAPFSVRMRVILGSAVLLWALILCAIGVF